MSHADEIDRLIGNDHGDRYIAWVQSTVWKADALDHIKGEMLKLQVTNTIMDARIVRILWEASWLERGYGLHNSRSSECDCPGDRDAIPMAEGRCTKCGARLQDTARRHRIEVTA